MESLKKQIIKKDDVFIITITNEEAKKIELLEGDVVQIEKCIIIPITEVVPDDLESYN